MGERADTIYSCQIMVSLCATQAPLGIFALVNLILQSLKYVSLGLSLRHLIYVAL